VLVIKHIKVTKFLQFLSIFYVQVLQTHTLVVLAIWFFS